jgi:hypothetical protein
MAESAEPEPGAPIAKDAIDPELVKLKRARPKIGLVTSAGMVFLCTFFLFRLSKDRHFGSEGDTPRVVQVADIAAGKVDTESFVQVVAEPMMSHSIRATKAKGDPGLRVTPIRGSGERVWISLDGVGWDPPITTNQYAGRLRKLGDMPFGDAVFDHAKTHPRPVFAAIAEASAGFATNQVKTVDGDTISARETDKVAYDMIDPQASIIVATFTPGTPDHVALLDGAAWGKAITALGFTVKALPEDEKDKALGQARFETNAGVPAVTEKLEGAKLWSARVEPVVRHVETTWGALKTASARTDLVGIYVSRGVPSDAYVLITGEVPQDYWYVLPITIVVGIIGLLFLWALVRSVRRDLLPARA